MSTPDKNDFNLDLRFTDRPNKLVTPLAIAAAAVIIIFIIATMTTSIAESFLPMSDQYLQVLVPKAADGKEPLSLTALDYPTEGNTLTVTGTVVNRTDFPVTGILAVVSAQDVNGVNQTIEVPLTPEEMLSQGSATFQTSMTFQTTPGSYQLKFRVADGPFVPHRDDRAAQFGAPIK